jgi:uncharacterized protein YhbP (UPF0306 family)
MTDIDKLIKDFIKKHHVLTLATSIDNQPYCCSCFYVYMPDENMFVFSSDHHTKHVQDVLQNNRVAGNIAVETKIVGKIQGIQFTGIMFEPVDELLQKAQHIYFKRFPYTIVMETHLWVIDLDFIKMTHNLLGFGKKMIWKKN